MERVVRLDRAFGPAEVCHDQRHRRRTKRQKSCIPPDLLSVAQRPRDGAERGYRKENDLAERIEQIQPVDTEAAWNWTELLGGRLKRCGSHGLAKDVLVVELGK